MNLRYSAFYHKKPDPYVPLAERSVPGLSAHVAQAIDWGLAFLPENRPQTAEAMRAALDGAAIDHASQQYAPSMRWCAAPNESDLLASEQARRDIEAAAADNTRPGPGAPAQPPSMLHADDDARLADPAPA